MIKFILAISVIIISGMILFHLQREKPDVRYDLWAGTILPGKDGSELFAQQIKVVNSGTKVAEDITLKVEADIIDFKISKNRTSDEITTSRSKKGIEIDYPSLSPEGEFSISLTVKKELNPQHVKVLHKGGNAEPITSSPKNVIGMVLSFCLITWFLALSYLGFNHYRENVAWRWQEARSYDTVMELLRSNRPWHMKKETYTEIRTELIDNAIKYLRSDTHYGDIDKSLHYRALGQKQPDFISKEKWNNIKDEAEKGLVRFAEQIANKQHNLDNKLYILKMRMPTEMQEKKWDTICKLMEDSWLSCSLINALKYFHSDSLESSLIQPKPDKIPEDKWTDYLDILKKLYVSYLGEKLTDYSSNSYSDMITFLDKRNLEPLGKKREYLENWAYKKEYIETKYKVVKFGSNEFLEKAKPDWLKIEDWKELQELATQLVSISKREEDSVKREDNSINRELKTTEKRKQVLRQLEVINDIFNDPTTIDRIEQGDILFATGNFENLKKMANYLKQTPPE